MKILNCPLNGPRNISEFTYGGEYHAMPDAAKSSRSDWAEYIFFHRNPAGPVIEWWCHTASAYWFLAERDTRNNEILRTMPVAEYLSEQQA